MLNLCAQNIAISQGNTLNKANDKVSTHSLILSQARNSLLSPSSRRSENIGNLNPPSLGYNSSANGSVTPKNNQNSKSKQLSSE